jgi:hypothetical protein
MGASSGLGSAESLRELAERRGPLIALTAHLDTVLAPRKADDIALDDDADPLLSRS